MSNLLVKTPVYQQLNLLLRELIRNGSFKVGEQFLTERQICARFGVSRATANKALSNLVAEGLLEFKKGIGTFVRGGVLQYDATALVSFTEKAQLAGMLPSTEVLFFGHPHTLADAACRYLQVCDGRELYYVERLRLANATPVILERRYVVARHCPELTAADLEGSLYTLWTRRYGLEIGGADETIRAVNLRGEEARLLRTRSGTAGFLVISTGYLAGGEPLWWEQTRYRGDLYEFHNRLGPLRMGQPAQGAIRVTSDEKSVIG
jgi:GntR family transcriptional regulator